MSEVLLANSHIDSSGLENGPSGHSRQLVNKNTGFSPHGV